MKPPFRFKNNRMLVEEPTSKQYLKKYGFLEAWLMSLLNRLLKEDLLKPGLQEHLIAVRRISILC